MNLCKLCCVGLLGVILSVIGWFIFIFYNAGAFLDVQPYGLPKCKSIPTPKSGHPCEDVQALSDGSLIISCGPLLDILQLFNLHIPYSGYVSMSKRISRLSKSDRGNIYRIVPHKEYQDPIPMKLKRYVHPDFQPHGMSLVKDGGIEMVYIVNHRRDGEFISVFKVNSEENALG